MYYHTLAYLVKIYSSMFKKYLSQSKSIKYQLIAVTLAGVASVACFKSILITTPAQVGSSIYLTPPFILQTQKAQLILEQARAGKSALNEQDLFKVIQDNDLDANGFLGATKNMLRHNHALEALGWDVSESYKSISSYHRAHQELNLLYIYGPDVYARAYGLHQSISKLPKENVARAVAKAKLDVKSCMALMSLSGIYSSNFTQELLSLKNCN